MHIFSNKLPAVQHERKPIIDKKEFTNNTSTPNFNSNALNKIYIRKDLSSEATLLPSHFPCDLGLPLFKRIGNSGGQDLSYHMSPSQMSVEDDLSTDSANTVSFNRMAKVNRSFKPSLEHVRWRTSGCCFHGAGQGNHCKGDGHDGESAVSEQQ